MAAYSCVLRFKAATLPKSGCRDTTVASGNMSFRKTVAMPALEPAGQTGLLSCLQEQKLRSTGSQGTNPWHTPTCIQDVLRLLLFVPHKELSQRFCAE